MEIEVRTIGEIHSLRMGDFGIELTPAETSELRRVLAHALQDRPRAETAAEEAASRRTQVQVDDDAGLQFNVGPFFWFFSREDSVELLSVLDELVSMKTHE